MKYCTFIGSAQGFHGHTRKAAPYYSAAHCRQIWNVSALIPNVSASFHCSRPAALRKAPGKTQRAQPPRPVFTALSSNPLHQTNNGEAKTTSFRALSTHKTHPKSHSPACAATAAKSPRNHRRTAQLSCFSLRSTEELSYRSPAPPELPRKPYNASHAYAPKPTASTAPPICSEEPSGGIVAEDPFSGN